MDLSSVLGLVVGWGCLLAAILIGGSHLGTFFNIEGALIVLGGTAGAAIVSIPWAQLKEIPGVLRKTFTTTEMNPMEVITILVGFATKARREGLLGLEDEAGQLEDKFLQKGIQLVVDGTDMELVRNILETDLAFLEERHKLGEGMFGTMGGFSPTMGIIGTVMGLIRVLGSLSDPSKLGPAVAVAFIATFYGISFANLIFLPISFKLKAKSAEEVLVRQVMIEGVLSISAGDNPRIVEEKLRAFIPPKIKGAMTKKPAEEEKK